MMMIAFNFKQYYLRQQELIYCARYTAT